MTFLIKLRLIFFGLFYIGSLVAIAQPLTISGTVYDAETNEPLPFCTISLPDASHGIISSIDGRFSFKVMEKTDRIVVAFVGYEDQYVTVTHQEHTNLRIYMQPSVNELDEVVVSSKRKKIRKKENPAIALMRKVRATKKANEINAFNYLTYDVYQKTEIGTEVTDKLLEKKFVRKNQFILDYVDTLDFINKPVLPIFFRESISRKTQNRQKVTEVLLDRKTSNLFNFLDKEGIEHTIKKIYQEVNIYDSDIFLFAKQFTGPLSPIASELYYFTIKDTIQYKNRQCVKVQFDAKNVSNFTFDGELTIDIDSSYAVVHAELIIPYGINVNFVKEGKIINEFDFEPQLNKWLLSSNTIFATLGGKKEDKSSLYIRQVVSNSNYTTQKRKRPITKLSSDKSAKRNSLWNSFQNKPPLSQREEKIGDFIDQIHNTQSFKRFSQLAKSVLGGYIKIGGFSCGSINSFYSFNDTEGARIKIGGTTNEDFSQKVEFSGYTLYGVRDEEIKYSLTGKYSFGRGLGQFPLNEISISHQHVTAYPGFDIRFTDVDNAFLSIKRGENDKLVFISNYKVDYQLEFSNNFSFIFGLKHESIRPYGAFDRGIAENTIEILTSSAIDNTEIGIDIRYAPNQTFFQGFNRRRVIKNKYPIYTLGYKRGLKNLLGGGYNYDKFTVNVFKRFYMSIFGYSDVSVQGQRLIGQNLPYLLLDVPLANQTYFSNHHSFNMMSFMEFVTDRSISFSVNHFFEGVLLNRIPVMKKTAIRVVVGLKGMWGSIDSFNVPESNDQLPSFPINRQGEPYIYTLGTTPYLESSVGLYNIFKLIRLELVQRLTYNDLPDVPTFLGREGLGLRMGVKLDF